MKITPKIIVSVVLLTGIVGTGWFIFNKDSKPVEDKKDQSSQTVTEQQTKEDKIKPYGEKVKVKNKYMNVLVKGEGKETLVIIPGYGGGAPGLSYTNLIKELSSKYKVVVVEPFGYGLSDLIDEERTIENITDEIHEALQQLGITKYTLVGHSIAGVYAMKYIEKYQNEVTAFIGLDSSTPNMHDGVQVAIGEEDSSALVDDLPNVSEEINEQYKLIVSKTAGNKNSVDEGNRIDENFDKVRTYVFPKELPVAFLLAKESIENRKMLPFEEPDWVKLHTDLTKNSTYTKVYEIDADHLLFETNYKEVAEKMDEFLTNVPNKN